MSESRELMQSYKLTVSTINAATAEAGVFAQRFIIRLVELVNDAGAIEGMKFRPALGWKGEDIDVHDPGAWAVRTVRIPLRDVMLPGVDNKTTAKAAIKALQQAVIDYTDKNPDTGKTRWRSFQFLGRVEIEDGIIEAEVQPEVWRLAVDFSMGFRAYELGIIMGLRSTFSMKLYPYVCRQEKELTMSIEDAKKFLGVEKKYKGKPKDFIRKCIEPAKQELDLVSPWSFDFMPITGSSGEKGGRPGITAIRFIPKHQLRFESEKNLTRELAPRAAGYYSLQSSITLTNKFRIEHVERYNPLFAKAAKVMNLDKFIQERSEELDQRRGTQYEVENAAGWFIHCLQDQLKGI